MVSGDFASAMMRGVYDQWICRFGSYKLKMKPDERQAIDVYRIQLKLSGRPGLEDPLSGRDRLMPVQVINSEQTTRTQVTQPDDNV